MIDIDKFAGQHKAMVNKFVEYYKDEAVLDTDDAWPLEMEDVDWEEQLDVFIQMQYERGLV